MHHFKKAHVSVFAGIPYPYDSHVRMYYNDEPLCLEKLHEKADKYEGKYHGKSI